MLEKELQFFKAKQTEWRAANPAGGYVVIRDQEFLGIWLNRTDAMKQGISKWGNVSFLVKNINDDLTNIVNFSRHIKFPNAFPNSQKH